MTETKSNPKWRRAFWLALKVYAGLCTLLLTAYLVFALWSTFFPQSTSSNETMFMASYGEYLSKESPKRADYFYRLAAALAIYSKEASMRTADVFKYLGKPDLSGGSAEARTLVYLYENPGATNKWAVYAFLKDGQLDQIGFNDATVNDHSGYQPYQTQ